MRRRVVSPCCIVAGQTFGGVIHHNPQACSVIEACVLEAWICIQRLLQAVLIANVPVELVGLVQQHSAGPEVLSPCTLPDTLKLQRGALSRKEKECQRVLFNSEKMAASVCLGCFHR